MSELLKEDVVIPAELSQQYLVVKKQMADKQGQKDLLMKQVNQKDNEINILMKNLIAIENKASQLQGKNAQAQEKAKPETPKPVENTATQPAATANESVNISDLLAELNEMDQNWVFEEEDDEPEKLSLKPEAESDDEESDDEEEPETLTPEEMEEKENESDYVFALRVITDDGEEIISKVYRNEDDEYWKIRVVQGDEIPLETMKYDPDMEFVDIMEKIGEIPGYEEVEEIPMEEYKELLDDKAENDAEYDWEQEPEEKPDAEEL